MAGRCLPPRRARDDRAAHRPDRGARSGARLARRVRRSDHRRAPAMMRTPLALLLGAVAGLVAATQPIADTDLFWHLATGRETLTHGIVRTDVFSWTVNGSPVSTDQWLGQVLLWSAYALADWRGVAMLRVALVVALVALVAWNAGASRPRPLALVLGAVPALVLTPVLWVDRPELLGLVALAALLVALRAGRAGDDRALVAAVAILALWANV